MTTIDLDLERVLAALVEGRGALGDDDRRALQRYLHDLATSRGFPLHPAVCFNALCWDFDLATGHYADAPVDDLVAVRAGERRPALSVGSFVSVPAGQGSDEFWGEVVYKEGRRIDLSPDPVDSWMSGPPSEVLEEEGRAICELREALVLDFDAVEEPNQQGLERQRERQTVMDSRRHVVVDAIYDAPDADLDDATYFARWTVRHLGASLRRSRFGVQLDDAVLVSDEQLVAALVAALTTLRDVMRDVPGCARWRDYLFDLAAYDERLGDPEIPLGRSDLDSVVASLARPPRTGLVEYRPLGPRLIQIAGQTADLNGPLWPAAICHASYYLTEWLRENAPEGVCDVLSKPVHLRLDDAWQWGGIWRAERIVDAPSAYCAIAPDIPLGLGYLESIGGFQDEPAVEDEPTGTSADLLARAVTLSVADIFNDRLSLPASMVDELRDTLRVSGLDTVVVRLAVEGLDLDVGSRVHHARVSTPAEPPSLIGVAWPPQFVPGTRVSASWSRSSTVLDVSLRRREEPFLLGEFPYIYECDPRLFLRAAGAGEPPDARGRSLRDLVLDVFRHRATHLDDQRRATTAVRATWAIYGPGAPAPAGESIRRLLEELCDEGVLTRRGDEYVWSIDGQSQPRVGDPELDDEDRHRFIVAHEVSPFLRTLAISPEASPERQALYRAYREELGCPSWLPPELPRGKTFVRAHERGQRPDPSAPPTPTH